MYQACAGDPDNWPTFFAKSARMWREEPTLTVEDLKGVQAPTMVLVGDDDAISWEHTLALYEGIGDSQLAVMPGTSHACTHAHAPATQHAQSPSAPWRLCWAAVS
jgi:pimeloyl-ACP methyl ester carboxylesterase